MKKKALQSENVVPVQEAAENCTRWRDTANQCLADSGPVYSFRLPMVDFTQIVDDDATAVRAYLAEEESGEKKLYLVGVDKEGNDMINYQEDQYIYDLTTPCPPTCPEPSPLTTGKK